MQIQDVVRKQSRVNSYAVTFALSTAFVLGMMVAAAYFPAVPANMGKLMAAMAMLSIFSGGMALLEAGR